MQPPDTPADADGRGLPSIVPRLPLTGPGRSRSRRLAAIAFRAAAAQRASAWVAAVKLCRRPVDASRVGAASRFRLLFACVFAFTAGAIAASLVWVASLGPYTDLLVINYKFEQELLADRAARSHDQLAEIVHRWNAVAAVSGEGFEFVRKTRESSLPDRITLPVAWCLVSHLRTYPDSVERGARIEEGILRGKLALALEGMGWQVESELQLARGVELGTAKDTEGLRRLAKALRPFSAETERIYLDPGHR